MQESRREGGGVRDEGEGEGMMDKIRELGKGRRREEVGIGEEKKSRRESKVYLERDTTCKGEDCARKQVARRLRTSTWEEGHHIKGSCLKYELC